MKIPRVLTLAFDFLLVLALDKVVHHARTERAWAVQCHQRNDVLKAIGLEFFFQLFRAARLGLKHRSGVARGENIEYFWVIQFELIQLKIRILRMLLFQIHHRTLEHGQVAQTEKVKLDQTNVFNVFFIVLADHRGRALRAIHRTKVGDFPRGNQHTARVHPDVARQPFKRFRQANDFLCFFFILKTLFKCRLVLECARQCPRVGWVVRDEFGQSITIIVRHVQNPSHVAHHGFCAKGTEGRNLRHRRHAVFALDVLNHLIAPVLTKVNIKVGHGDTLGIQKSLKQQRVLKRIQIGNQ